MQTANVNFNVKARLVSEMLSPAKATKFLQTDETARAGVVELVETAGKLRQMMGKDTAFDGVTAAFSVLNEGKFVAFLDMNKPAAQRGKLNGGNILETIVSVSMRGKLSDEAKAFLADNTPQTAE
jgi:hypothetical protein